LELFQQILIVAVPVVVSTATAVTACVKAATSIKKAKIAIQEANQASQIGQLSKKLDKANEINNQLAGENFRLISQLAETSNHLDKMIQAVESKDKDLLPILDEEIKSINGSVRANHSDVMKQLYAIGMRIDDSGEEAKEARDDYYQSMIDLKDLIAGYGKKIDEFENRVNQFMANRR
jgi:hypothetical protein